MKKQSSDHAPAQGNRTGEGLVWDQNGNNFLNAVLTAPRLLRTTAQGFGVWLEVDAESLGGEMDDHPDGHT